MCPPTSCPHCGQSLPNAGPACPHCQRPLNHDFRVPGAPQSGPLRSLTQDSQQHNEMLTKAYGILESQIKDDPFLEPFSDLKYQRMEVLGKGGMGAVYRVLDRKLERFAALKVLLTPHPDTDQIDRFIREARITAKLDHPGIPPVFEAGKNIEGYHYLLMRLIGGQTLKDRLREWRSQARPENLPLPLLEALCRSSEAVAYAHSQSIVHRDLKPENIMIGEFGEVLVLDWGIARDFKEQDKLDRIFRATLDPLASHIELQESGLTQAGTIVGTPGYMPPEQIHCETISDKTDVFSLGLILCEILSGKPAILGQSPLNKMMATVKNEIQFPSANDCPKELLSLCRASTAPLPLDRPSSQDFHKNLKAFLGGQVLDLHSYTWKDKLFRALARRPAFVTGFLSLLILGLFLQAFWAQRDAAKEKSIQQKVIYDQSFRTREEFNSIFNFRYIPKLPPREEERLQKRIQFQIDRTFKELDQAIAKNPQTPLYHILRGQALLKLNKHEEALTAANNAIHLAPQSPKAWLLKTEALNVQSLYKIHSRSAFKSTVAQNSKEAQASYHKAIEFGAEPNQLREGWHYFRIAKYKKTLTTLEQLSDAPPEEISYLRAFANYQLTKDLAALEADISLTLKICPRFPLASLMRCLTRQNRGRIKEALEDAHSVIEAMPKNPYFYNLRGSLHLLLRKHMQALFDFNKALQLKPDLHNALVNRGIARAELGDKALALQDFTAAIQLKPQLPSLYKNRSKFHLQFNDSKAALADLAQVLKISPKDGDALLRRAKIFLLQKKYNEALPDLNRLLQLTPNHIEGRFRRSLVYRKSNALRKARGDLLFLLKTKPKTVMDRIMQGQALHDFKRYQEAIDKYNEGVAMDSKNPVLFFSRGRAYRVLNDLNQAIRDFSSAIKIRPNYVEAYGGRAACFSKLNKINEAISDYSQALQLNPGIASYYANRGSLYIEVKRPKLALTDLRRFLSMAPNHPSAGQIRRLATLLEKQLRKQ